MKHLKVEDFSFKGHKSAIQSDDTQFFEEFVLGGNMYANTNANTDDRMSITSDPLGTFHPSQPNNGSSQQ